MAQFKSIQIHKNYKPWLLDSTKKKMPESEILHTRAVKSVEDYRKKYKILRNKIMNRQKTVKLNGQKIRLNEGSADCFRMWKLVRKILT